MKTYATQCMYVMDSMKPKHLTPFCTLQSSKWHKASVSCSDFVET